MCRHSRAPLLASCDLVLAGYSVDIDMLNTSVVDTVANSRLPSVEVLALLGARLQICRHSRALLLASCDSVPAGYSVDIDVLSKPAGT